MPGYQVITRAVRDEAPKWDEFARQAGQIRSEHGYVTLHLRGPNPVGLTANTDVLGYANSDVLRRDVLAVFADAGLTTED